MASAAWWPQKGEGWPKSGSEDTQMGNGFDSSDKKLFPGSAQSQAVWGLGQWDMSLLVDGI